MFIEASSTSNNDVARMRTPEMTILDGSGPHCFTLFYHMYGSETGSLRILREEGNAQTTLFELNGVYYFTIY